jgi:hypothetical protein
MQGRLKQQWRRLHLQLLSMQQQQKQPLAAGAASAGGRHHPCRPYQLHQQQPRLCLLRRRREKLRQWRSLLHPPVLQLDPNRICLSCHAPAASVVRPRRRCLALAPLLPLCPAVQRLVLALAQVRPTNTHTHLIRLLQPPVWAWAWWCPLPVMHHHHHHCPHPQRSWRRLM